MDMVKIAAKLNELRVISRSDYNVQKESIDGQSCIVWVGRTTSYRDRPIPPDSAEVKAKCWAIYQSHWQEAVRQEVLSAAMEDRLADVEPAREGYSWDRANAQCLCCRMSQSEMVEVLTAAKDRWVRVYECYRQQVASGACPVESVKWGRGCVSVTRTGEPEESYHLTGTLASLVDTNSPVAIICDRLQECPEEAGMGDEVGRLVVEWLRANL